MRKLLIIRIGGVGDTLLLLPFILALRETYPDSHLELMGYPERIQIFKDFGYVDEIKSFDQPGISSFFVKDEILPERLVEYFSSFDTIFAFLKDEKGIFNHNLQRCRARKSYVFSPYLDENIHILDYYKSLCRSLGLKNSNWLKSQFLAPSTSPSPLEGEGTDEGRTVAIHPVKKFYGVHPGAGSKKKCWPAENFVEIIDWLEEKYQLKTLLIYGPAEEKIVQKVLDLLKKASPKVVRDISLTDLAFLLNKCLFYLGNDSGISHLSAFTGIPTISLFGSDEYQKWAPCGENVYIYAEPEGIEKISPSLIKTTIDNLFTPLLKMPHHLPTPLRARAGFTAGMLDPMRGGVYCQKGDNEIR